MANPVSPFHALTRAFWQSSRKGGGQRELILHVGAPKTASTFIVRALKAKSDDLGQKADLKIIFRRAMIDGGLSSAFDMLRLRGKLPGKFDLAASLRDLGGSKHRKVLMTNENTISSLRTPDFFDNAELVLEQIRAAWPGPIRVLLYTRAQPDLIESAYLQHWHLGRSPAFGDFLARCKPEKMSWLRVVDTITSIVGSDNTHVRPYESIKRIGDKAYFLDFLKMVGVENPKRFAITQDIGEGRVQNRSYSSVALKMAEQIYPLITADEQKLLRTFLQTNFSTATHPKAVLLSTEQRAEILDMHRDDNKKLFDTWMHDFTTERDRYV